MGNLIQKQSRTTLTITGRASRIVPFMKRLVTTLALVLTAPLSQASEPTIVSQIRRNTEGKAYLEVDGKPMLYNAAQAWKAPTEEYSMEGGYPANVNKAHEVGYRIFTFWLYWRDLEPERGKYDWSTLDAMIKRANELDVRLDIVWGGSNFCSHLDPRFAPDWLLDWDAVHLKDENGKLILCKSGDFGMCRGVDHTNQELLATEQELVRRLLVHLKSQDKNHRVVFFQVLNEPNMRGWTNQGIEPCLTYANKLASVLKQSDYRIATRMNVAGKQMFSEIDELENIDCHGTDPYTFDIAEIRQLVSVPTKMPHIAENAAYENTTSLMIAAFTSGAGYNVYMLGPDLVWEKPGIYDLNWVPWKVTFGVYNLNSAVNRIGSLIAVTPKSRMIGFNTETSNPDANYEQMKSLAGHEIGMKTWGRGKTRNGAVGMALYTDGYYYLVGDRITWFKFQDRPVEISSGRLNASGQWRESIRKYYHEIEGQFHVPYHAGECLRVKLAN